MTASHALMAEGASGCEQWVQPGEGSGTLGENAMCSWEAPDKLRVLVGRQASIRPGDSLVFMAQGVASRGVASNEVPRHAVVVLAPRVASVPELVLSGPPEVGGCDEASLFVSGPSALALTFEWGCDTSEVVRLYLANISGSEAILPGSLLPLNEPTTIWVTATTFLGATSPRLEHQVRMLVRGVMLCSVDKALSLSNMLSACWNSHRPALAGPRTRGIAACRDHRGPSAAILC
eukprot:3030692-Rhodomonas_salina.1